MDATIKSNTLAGDGVAASDDVGVCSDATFETIRANKITDYDDDIALPGFDCTAEASPAD